MFIDSEHIHYMNIFPGGCYLIFLKPTRLVEGNDRFFIGVSDGGQHAVLVDYNPN